MKLSVIMPVYNERNTVREIISKVKKVAIRKEILIVDDNSTDGTREILWEIAQNNDENDIKIIFHKNNLGKGSCIRTALKYATGDIVIIQDGDLEYDPNDYYKLIQPIMEDKAKIVYGSRNLNKDNKRSYIYFFWGGKFLSWLTNFLYHTDITDEATCYKVFRKEVLENIHLKCKGFEFCPEVTAKVSKHGYKIIELPISYYPRLMKEGKKIRWKDGLFAIWTLIKYRFFD